MFLSIYHSYFWCMHQLKLCLQSSTEKFSSVNWMPDKSIKIIVAEFRVCKLLQIKLTTKGKYHRGRYNHVAENSTTRQLKAAEDLRTACLAEAECSV